MTKAEVLGGTKEGGVDFYGLLELNRLTQRVLLKDAKIRIIGQAKQHKNVVGHREVRIFKTHIDDLLKKKGNAVKKLPSWFVESTQIPMLSVFIVTTKPTRGTKIFAKENGILLMDGEQVVQDLMESTHNREWFSRKNGELVFDKLLFDRYFSLEEPAKPIRQPKT
jgi:restriction endonuclease Mrr